MKLSDKPTDWLILKAGVQSEWDSCDFVLVRLTPEYINLLKERANLAGSFQDNIDLYCLDYWDSPFCWYRSPDDDMEILEVFLNGPSNWSFIEFDHIDELDWFAQPEQRIDIQQLTVYKDGDARFTGAGKYTDEKFWTLEFPIDKL